MEFSPTRELELSQYVSAEKISAMSEMEQRICANTIKNYEMLKYVGKYATLIQ